MSLKAEPTFAKGRGWRSDGPRVCPIADALEVVGERYALLVVRELGMGVRRFSDIRHNTGAPRETLATRLKKLETMGIIERRRYCEHPPRDEYFLTEAGQALLPAVVALRQWGEAYVAPRPDDALAAGG